MNCVHLPYREATWLLVPVLVGLIAAACAPTPVDIKFDKAEYVLEGNAATLKIDAKAIDADGNTIDEGVDLTYFCENRNIIKVDNDGTVTAVASGEDKVEVEVVGAEIKKTITVRVKIAANVETTHEKLRLWTGQVKKNVAAWVISEKGAYIEGYLPTWTSDDPSIVSVKNIEDPSASKYKRAYVEMKGMKSGDTFINATFEAMSKQIKVRVYSEDEEVDLAGRRKPAGGDAKEGADEAQKAE